MPAPAVGLAAADAAELATPDAAEDVAEDAELAAEPVAVAEAVVPLEAVPVAEAVAEEEAQVAVVGRSVTPWGRQRFWAKSMTAEKHAC